MVNHNYKQFIVFWLRVNLTHSKIVKPYLFNLFVCKCLCVCLHNKYYTMLMFYLTEITVNYNVHPFWIDLYKTSWFCVVVTIRSTCSWNPMQLDTDRPMINFKTQVHYQLLCMFPAFLLLTLHSKYEMQQWRF